LPLAAAQLVRMAAQGLLWSQPHPSQGILYQLTGFGFGLGEAELGDRGSQDVVNFVEGIVRLERILKDGLNLSSERPPFLSGHSLKVLPFMKDFAAGGGDDTQKQADQGRFAATAFTGYCSDRGRVAADSQGEVLQGDSLFSTEKAAACAKQFGDMTCLKKRGHR